MTCTIEIAMLMLYVRVFSYHFIITVFLFVRQCELFLNNNNAALLSLIVIAIMGENK